MQKIKKQEFKVGENVFYEFYPCKIQSIDKNGIITGIMYESYETLLNTDGIFPCFHYTEEISSISGSFRRYKKKLQDFAYFNEREVHEILVNMWINACKTKTKKQKELSIKVLEAFVRTIASLASIEVYGIQPFKK